MIGVSDPYRLWTADADGLDVERRQSEETVTPIDPEE